MVPRVKWLSFEKLNEEVLVGSFVPLDPAHMLKNSNVFLEKGLVSAVMAETRLLYTHSQTKSSREAITSNTQTQNIKRYYTFMPVE